MSEQHTSPSDAQRPRLAGPVQLLRRSTTDRKIAGVCGGLGAYTNIDPLVFRVLFAVFSLFGGFGLLLYGAGWLIIPEEGQERSEGQRLLQGQGTSAAAAWAAGATVLGLIVFIAVATEQWKIVAWLIVITAIAYFIVRSRYPAGDAQVPPWWQAPGSSGAAPSGDAGQESSASGSQAPPPTSSHASVPSPPGGSPSAGPARPPPARPPPPVATMHQPAPVSPPPKQPRSITGWVTFFMALIVSGVLASLDLADVADIPAVVIIAVALVILGTGLVVSTWFGRARAVIFPAVLLVIALAIGSTLGSTLRGPIGDLEAMPRSASEIDDPYRLAIGDLRIDLRELDVTNGAATLEASVGVGRILVLYPDDVRIVAETSFGIGGVETSRAKTASETGETVRIEPQTTQSRGTITLDLSVGIGAIEFREAAPR